jgi:branched-chain amino acid transport system substrate-binding protein
MKNFWKIAGLLFFSATAIIAAEKPVIKIGVICPLSGEIAMLGEADRNSIRIAQDKLGETRLRYEVVFEDHRGDALAGISAFHKLRSVEKVNAVITVSDHISMAIVPLAKKYRILQFSTGTTPGICDGKYSFANWTPPARYAEAFVAECEKRGIQSFSIVGIVFPAFKGFADATKKLAAARGIKLLNEHWYTADARDFRMIAAKLKTSAAQTVVILSYKPTIELLMTQLRQAGLKNLTALESFSWMGQPDLAEGLWYVAGADPEPWFTQEYRSRYKIEPFPGGANAHDAFRLIVQACENAKITGIPTAEEISRELHAIKNFPSAMGPLTILPDGSVDSQAVLKTIRKGIPVIIN